MKLFLLAVCFVALATARPKGVGGGEKKGPNPIKGLVRLCIGLAEEALEEDNKRSWEDVFGQLAPVCQAILEELEDKEGPKPSGPPPSEAPEKRRRGRMGDDDGERSGKEDEGSSGDDDDKVRPSGPPPSGPPERSSGDDDKVRPSGPPPSGPPPSSEPRWMNARRMGKEDDDDEEVDPVEALLKICEGLAKMAEKEEEAGESKRTMEALLEAMKAVCEAAFEEAEQDK